jgi:hypothetical protein
LKLFPTGLFAEQFRAPKYCGQLFTPKIPRNSEAWCRF